MKETNNWYLISMWFVVVQWEQNKGNCGVCGDAYNLETPRPHEAGGQFAKGVIGRRYSVGQVKQF